MHIFCAIKGYLHNIQRKTDFECKDNVLRIDNMMISMYSDLEGDYDIKKVFLYISIRREQEERKGMGDGRRKERAKKERNEA